MSTPTTRLAAIACLVLLAGLFVAPAHAQSDASGGKSDPANGADSSEASAPKDDSSAGDTSTADNPKSNALDGSETPASDDEAARGGDSGRGKAKSLFDGKSLEGWKVADQYDFQHGGRVHVQDGHLHLEAGGPGTGIYRADEPPRSNYELTLEARRVDGRDFFCGLTFPVKDEYCTLILGGWGGGVVGLSNINGNSAVENDTTTWSEFEQGRWYKIRLRVTDQEIVVWLDDKVIIRHDVPGYRFNIWWEMEPMRPLGIATWYTHGALRNIVLTHPAPPLKPSEIPSEDP